MERQGNLFNVNMGAYDGVEGCELVCIFILSKIGKNCNKNDVVLYKKNSLCIFKNISDPDLEHIKWIFKHCLKLTS